MPLVEYEKRDNHLAVVTLNRPEKLNAVNEELLADLRAAWLHYRDDEDAWLAILTGKGRAFTAGADKSWFEKSLQGQDSLGIFLEQISLDPYWSGTLDKPVIAAVNGFCVGFGLDLVLKADLRVAAESVWFQQPEVARGNIVLFFDNLPGAMAAEMISGFRISARRAYEVGLVNRLAPEGRVLEAALEMAGELLEKTPLALYQALKILRDLKNAGRIVPRRLLDQYTTSLSRELTRTEDYRETTAAFLEGRKPVFQKR
ncbi:MAG: enoyl-CoA hydratase/isomerase family protein [Deltaproteobacteria bacterium]|nr:enoyl-CoA hydratase/isomerase family protein [Deltaproteobacteria bacterium]